MKKSYAKILENCESLCYIEDNICEAKYYVGQILKNLEKTIEQKNNEEKVDKKQKTSSIQNKKEV